MIRRKGQPGEPQIASLSGNHRALLCRTLLLSRMAPPGWDRWVDQALEVLDSRKLVRDVRAIRLPSMMEGVETFDGPGPWDRSSVEVEVEELALRTWIGEAGDKESVQTVGDSGRKLLLFSGNDYLGLSSHPAVCKAAAEAAQRCGMGPRGSALICGYTNYHCLLESSLAALKKKEDCLLFPTGFAANLAFMSTLGRVSSLLAVGTKPSDDEKVAIFSDSLNHASIIDGIHIIQRLQEAEVFVYRHCDPIHLETLLSCCRIGKKVVITDSLFSMDGDFAPLTELVELRNKHRFLLAIDDAHGTFACGENGGGVAELYDCENDVDICIGTLSKAAGCLGGFIACSKKWKQLMQSTSRSFIFSTALPSPIVAAAHAALIVSKKEKWRRRAIWDRVQDFSRLTQLPITSPIISVVLGSEESALQASRFMLKRGFHVIAVRPPSVPPNSCRLRLTLSAAHTLEDIKMLAEALLLCMKSACGNKERNLRGSKL